MAELPRTEQRNPRSIELGTLSALEVVRLMDEEEPRTLAAVRAADTDLAVVADRVAAAARAGRVVFLGAGTSGRIAVQEVAELAPTFGVAPATFLAFVAGGRSLGPAAVSASEDDVQGAARALAGIAVGPADVVIGIAASGTTPFVVAGLQAAAARGAWTCGIANNPGTPVLTEASHAVLLDTGPEVLTGSTRLQAATAQKLALNRITTAAMIVLGHVIENHMVDVVVTVTKLQRRAIRIVCDLAAVDETAARRALESSNWNVRDALRSAVS